MNVNRWLPTMLKYFQITFRFFVQRGAQLLKKETVNRTFILYRRAYCNKVEQFFSLPNLKVKSCTMHFGSRFGEVAFCELFL